MHTDFKKTVARNRETAEHTIKYGINSYIAEFKPPHKKEAINTNLRVFGSISLIIVSPTPKPALSRPLFKKIPIISIIPPELS